VLPPRNGGVTIVVRNPGTDNVQRMVDLFSTGTGDLSQLMQAGLLKGGLPVQSNLDYLSKGAGAISAGISIGTAVQAFKNKQYDQFAMSTMNTAASAAPLLLKEGPAGLVGAGASIGKNLIAADSAFTKGNYLEGSEKIAEMSVQGSLGGIGYSVAGSAGAAAGVQAADLMLLGTNIVADQISNQKWVQNLAMRLP
jgi:hypothetical protein